MLAAFSVFKPSVQNVHQLQQHTIEVSFEMTGLPIALSMNFCGKSFHIDSSAVFSSAMLDGFGVYF